jgi:hypothetical protein
MKFDIKFCFTVNELSMPIIYLLLKKFSTQFICRQDNDTRSHLLKRNQWLLLILTSVFSTANFAQELLIRTHDSGFYAMTYSELEASGIISSKTRINKIHLNDVNGEVPFFLQSGKKSFNKNDSIIFFTEKLHGKKTYQHVLDDNNGFKLSIEKKPRCIKNGYYLLM